MEHYYGPCQQDRAAFGPAAVRVALLLQALHVRQLGTAREERRMTNAPDIRRE